jgi:hypothetical protein
MSAMIWFPPDMGCVYRETSEDGFRLKNTTNVKERGRNFSEKSLSFTEQ